MPDKVSLRLKPIKVSRAGAKKMTTSSKTITIKKSENGKAKSTEKIKVEFKPKATIAETKKMLEDQITIFQEKAILIGNREKFEVIREELMDYIKEQGSDFNSSLDSHNLKLVLLDNRKYSSDKKIQIANNAVINDILGILLVRVNQRISELELEIIS